MKKWGPKDRMYLFFGRKRLQLSGQSPSLRKAGTQGRHLDVGTEAAEATDPGAQLTGLLSMACSTCFAM